MLFSVTAWSKVNIGDLAYNLDEETLTASVADLLSLPADSIVRIPETVEQDGKTYTVVEIGWNAFAGTPRDRYPFQVKRFVVPKTVKRIGRKAFYIPGNRSSSSTLYHCALEGIDFAEGSQLEELGEQAFGTTCLNEIDLPEGLKVIGEKVFYQSQNLERVGLPSTLDSIGPSAFEIQSDYYIKMPSIELPANLRAVAERAFYNCKFDRLALPASVDTIGSNAFAHVSSILPQGSKPAAIATDAFSKTVEVVVDEDFIENYLAAPVWKDLSVYAGVITDDQGRTFRITGKNIVTLQSFGQMTEVTIPDAVETVVYNGKTYQVEGYSKDAFGQVEVLHVERAYKELPYWIFGSGLRELYLPASIEVVESSSTTQANNGSMFNACSGVEVHLSSPVPPVITATSPFSTLWLDEAYIPAYAESNWNTLNLNPFTTTDGFSCSRLFSDLTGVSIIGSEGGDIVIPESITYEENTYHVASVSAISSQVTSVVVESAATELSSDLFAQKVRLQSVTLPEGMTVIPPSFFYLSGVKTVHLPSTITKIGEYAFQRAQQLKHLDLPEGLKQIDFAAFLGSGLESIQLPASCDSIQALAFSLPTLKEFAVADGNEKFCAVDGVLFSKDKKVLYAWPGDKAVKHYEVPMGTEQIACYSFMPSQLTSIRLPESFKSIRLLEGRSDSRACQSDYGPTIVYQSIPNAAQVEMFGSAETVCLPAEYDDWMYWTDEDRYRMGMSEEEFDEWVSGLEKRWEDAKKELRNYTVMTERDESQNAALPVGYQPMPKAYSLRFDTTHKGFVVKSVNVPMLPSTLEIPEEIVVAWNNEYYSQFTTWIERYCSRNEDRLYHVPIVGIEDIAFAHCDSLQSITLPASLKYIGEAAFFGCQNLSEVRGLDKMGISSSDTYRSTGITRGVFRYAFAECPNLKELRWGGDVDFSAQQVVGNIALRRIVLPDSLLNIQVGDRHFYTVDDNIIYSTVQDQERDADGKYQKVYRNLLNYYPAGREAEEYVVPDSVIEILRYACANTRMASLTLPASVKYIDHAAFLGNQSLTKVVMQADSIEDLPLIANSYAEMKASNYDQMIGYSAYGNPYTFIGHLSSYKADGGLGYVYTDDRYPAFDTGWTRENTVLYVKQRVYDELKGNATHYYHDIFKDIQLLADETTGITAIMTKQLADGWFTIDGRSISRPIGKGLYIHNGRKVVVK